MSSGRQRDRDNIRVSIQGGHPVIAVQRLSTTVPPDGAIFQTRFTLTGTLPDETLLGKLPQPLCAAAHPGYTSIGVVAAVGPACHGLAPRDLVLTPATYTTYQLLHGADLRALSQTLLCRIPTDHNAVAALFAPLISLSMQMAREVAAVRASTVTLLGCGVLGALLLRVLKRELPLVQAIVYVDVRDLSKDDLYGSGADWVLDASEVRSVAHPKSQAVVMLSPAVWCAQIAPQLLAPEGVLLSAIATPEERSRSRRPAWLQCDAVQEALDLLASDEIGVEGLIAEHIHAEASADAYRAILTHIYQGRAIVYDW